MNDLSKKNKNRFTEQQSSRVDRADANRANEVTRGGQVLTSGRRGSHALESLTTEQFLGLIGSRVRKHRSDINMSRKSLAKTSGVSERYLAQLESGNGNISIALLRKVALAIGVKMEQLMAEETQQLESETFDHA